MDQPVGAGAGRPVRGCEPQRHLYSCPYESMLMGDGVLAGRVPPQLAATRAPTPRPRRPRPYGKSMGTRDHLAGDHKGPHPASTAAPAPTNLTYQGGAAQPAIANEA
ncbi:MAG TPA: hypothetical protein VF043_37075 [Ktedonobacteraceae bacterium]